MKNILKNFTKLLMTLTGIVMLVASCEYETNVRPAEYPDQVIYMPAAYGGFYMINDVARRIGDPPIEGYPSRYAVDLTGRKFNIPLGVYRGGINNKGSFTVDIAVNTDTINDLITAGKLVDTELLASDNYSVASSVNVLDGQEVATFNFSVNLDLLRDNYPDKKYAIAVGISSAQRATNPKLSTTIVVIDTKMMKPTAGFTYSADPTNSKLIKFTNTSLYANSFSWNFGDGSAASTEQTPTHIYSTAGTYTVTQTASGVTGSEDSNVFILDITVL